MTAKYFFVRASGLALGYVRNSLWRARPKAWNQLPAHLRALETVGHFKTALKTYLHSTQWLSQIVWHTTLL